MAKLKGVLQDQTKPIKAHFLSVRLTEANHALLEADAKKFNWSVSYYAMTLMKLGRLAMQKQWSELRQTVEKLEAEQ